MGGVNINGGNPRLNHALDLLAGGMSVADVSKATGYAISSLERYKHGLVTNGKCERVTFDENAFILNGQIQ